jgi:transcription antitermination factor NusG
MPLLPLEPYLFPDNLLSAPADGTDGPACWWVLHTRPRCEKTLARKLLDGAIPFFLPLYQRQWSAQGRRFRSFVPLFPGYVFLHADEEGRLAALVTNQVAQVLPVADQRQLHADLVRVNHLIASGLPLGPEAALHAGRWVEIIHGPLAGLRGQIIREGANCRFLVEVQFLKAGVSVDVERHMLRALDERESAGFPAA